MSDRITICDVLEFKLINIYSHPLRKLRGFGLHVSLKDLAHEYPQIKKKQD